MKVSYFFDKNDPARYPHNSYGDIDKLEIVELKDILYKCCKIPKNRGKGESGCIFAMEADHFWNVNYIEENDIMTSGAVFCDLDALDPGDADKILDKWDEIRKILPNIEAMWKSYSGNLHVVFYTEHLYKAQYKKQELLALIYLVDTIDKVCGIRLDDGGISKKKAQIDTHNDSFSQRLMLNYVDESDIRYNDTSVIMNFKDIERKDLVKCPKEWRSIVNSIVNLDSEFTCIDTKKDWKGCKFKYTFKNSGVISDRYYPHNRRWGIYTALYYLFNGDAEKAYNEYCNLAKYFNTDNNRKKYSDFIKEAVGWKRDLSYYPAWDLLTKFGYDIRRIYDDDTTIKKGEYISDIKFKNKILEEIKNNDRVEIVAPCGTGKTSLLNGREMSDRDDVFEKSFSLARELNAVVVVPYNATNMLYDNLIEVSSSVNEKIKIKEDNSYTMVIDQAVIHWDEIKNKNIIIDEAHCLYMDQKYRESAIKLMNKLNDFDKKLIMITATPLAEAELLKCKKLEFKNEREMIYTEFNVVDHVDICELYYIKRLIEGGFKGKIVVFDNHNASKLYENLIVDENYINDVAYIRASTKNSDDFIDLRKSELLKKKITICTCVAFNGLNFKNENEEVVVITHYVEGDTTYADLIQEPGRIRKSKVKMVVFLDGKKFKSTLDERKENAKILHDAAVERNIPDSLLNYDRSLLDSDIFDARKNIEETMIRESDLEVIIKRLNSTGYFMISRIKDLRMGEESGGRLSLKVKRKMSEEFIEDLKIGEIVSYSEGSYKDTWKKSLDNLTSTYVGITVDLLLRIVEKKNKNTLVDNGINKIRDIVKVAVLSEEEWKSYDENIEWLRDKLSSEVKKRDLMVNYKKNKKNRKLYKDKVKVLANGVFDVSDIAEDLFDVLEKEYNQERENRRSVKLKMIKDPDSGKEFNGQEEASKELGVSVGTVKRWLKSGKLIKMR